MELACEEIKTRLGFDAVAPGWLGRGEGGSAGGWKLVPIKPTEEMHAAAVRTISRCNGNDDFPPRVYAAMLAAAPVARRLPATAEKDAQNLRAALENLMASCE